MNRNTPRIGCLGSALVLYLMFSITYDAVVQSTRLIFPDTPEKALSGEAAFWGCVVVVVLIVLYMRGRFRR